MTTLDVQGLAEQIQGRIQGGRLVIDEQSGIAEMADVLAVLPGRLLDLSGVVFERTDSGLRLSGRWTGEWLLAAGQRSLALTDLQMKLKATSSMIECAVEGQTAFGGGAYQIQVAIGDGAELAIEMEPGPDNPPIGFSDLGALVGDQDALAPLSDALGALGFDGVRPGRLVLGLDLSAHKVTRVDVAVELQLRGVALAGYLGYPDLWIGGGLAPGSHIDLPALARQMGVDTASLPALGVSELAFKVMPERREFALAARFESGWRIGVGKTSVGLTALELDLGASIAGVHAKIDAWASLGDALCVASLTLPGLEFSLGLAPGHSLGLAALIDALLPGDISLPEGAPALVFVGLELKAQPREQTFTLSATTGDMWPLPFGHGLALGRLQLALAARREGDTVVPSALLAGTLALGGAELSGTLTLEKGGSSLSFVQGGAPLSVTAVIAGFVPGVALPDDIVGLDKLELGGLFGSFDFATKKYKFTGQASLAGLTLGALSVPEATGAVEIVGTGTTLESLTVSLAASFAQDLVPALQIDSVTFSLELRRVDGRWKWQVGGTVVVQLFDLPSQTLSANAANGKFRFIVDSNPLLQWSLPDAADVLSLTFKRMELALERDEVSKKTAWSFECTGGLQLALLPAVSGKLGLYAEANRRGFTFTADEGQGELSLKVPLVPGDARMTVGCGFKVGTLSLMKEKDWALKATSSLTWEMPKPGAADSVDPVDKALTILGEIFKPDMTATIAATNAGVSLTVAELPRVPVPVPVLVGHELVWDRLGYLSLSKLELQIGKTIAGKGILRVEMPEEINNIFGQDHGKPKIRVFTNKWDFGVAIDDKTGLSLLIESLPIDLTATNYVKQEKDGDRTWSRFTLGDVFSFRYGTFKDSEGSWIHVDHRDIGELRFQQPMFAFNGADFVARVDVDIVRPLRIPTAPLRWLLVHSGLQNLADVLPTHVAPLDIHVLDPVTKSLDAGKFKTTLKDLAAAMETVLPGQDVLDAVVDIMAGKFNDLPQDFRAYLDFSAPKRLDVNIAVTPATGLGVKFDIRAPREPLRFLIPNLAVVYGITLRKLSFGEILSGSLLLVAADLDQDCFDMPSLAASLLLPRSLTDHLTDTPSIQRKLIVGDLLCLVVYETAVPIPIPIWFDELGFKHHGLEGVRSQLVLHNNLSRLTMGSLLKGLCALFKEFKRFFTEAEYELPADLFSRNNLNLGIHVQPGFVQLPKYLGGGLLGSEQELLNLGIDSLLVPVVNFLKMPDIGKLLAIIPLELRQGALGGDAPLRIGPFAPKAVWLLSTTREFDALVAQRSGFVRSLYASGEADGNALVLALKDTAAAAASGARHDGVVVYAMGALSVPDLHCSVNMFAGMIADRERGFLTQFRLKGEVGTLLELDLGGRLAVLQQRSSTGEMTADLELDGAAEFFVLKHRVLSSELALRNGEFTFTGALSLFPPNQSFVARADVKGKISRDDLHIAGRAELALAPLPATHADLLITYGRAELAVSWLGQRWLLQLAARGSDQYVLTAGADAPVTVLSGLVTLLHASDEAKGPWLELAGPRDASVALSGRLKCPRLGAEGLGRLSISPGRLESEFSSKFFGMESSLVLRGESLDRPTSVTFAAEFKGDLFGRLTDLLHAEFAKVVAGARQFMDAAEELFKQEWARFKALVEKGYNEVRAAILDAKARVEKLIEDLSAVVDGVLNRLRVNEDEIAARKQVLQTIKQGTQSGLKWLEDRVADARRNLLAKRDELQRHDDWYAGLDGVQRFWLWGYHAARRLQLVIEVEVLPTVLAIAEAELRRAQSTVGHIVDGADQFLQLLDRLRNGLLDELQRHKNQIMERKRELDRYNDLLLKRTDELLQEFGRTVDSGLMEAARKGFDAARAVVDGFDAANEFIRAHSGLPFEVQRLAVAGVLGTHEGKRFEARADVKLNMFERPMVAQNLGFTVNFGDLADTAAFLARDLWDRRTQIELVDYEAYHRAQTRQLDQDYAALQDQRRQLGPDFGETLDKKLLLDMSWDELAEFSEHALQNAARLPVLKDVADLLAFLGGLLEPVHAAAKARQLMGDAYTRLQQANPGRALDIVDPTGPVEQARRRLLGLAEQVFKRAASESPAGSIQFDVSGPVAARPFRVASMQRIDWDAVPGNELGLLKGQAPAGDQVAPQADLAAPPSTSGAVAGPIPWPCALLFSGPDLTGDVQVLRVGSYDLEQLTIGNDRCRSLLVMPGFRVWLYEHARFQGRFLPVTHETTLQSPGMGVSGALVEPIDAVVEIAAQRRAAGPGAPCAVLFSGPDFTGDVQVLRVGHYDLEQLTIGNDRCQSLVVLPGYRVQLFEHGRFQGTRLVATEDSVLPQLSIGVSGAIVEAAVAPPTAPSPPVSMPCAVLFSEPGFSGDVQILRVGRYDMEQLTIGNDRCQSLMVLPGHRVRLYEHARFQGASVVVTHDTVRQRFGIGVSGVVVEAIDLGVELPGPKLAAWAALLSEGDPQFWRAGRAVRYAIGFEFADGRILRSGWWSTALHATADPDGYVTLDTFGCPMLSNISRDPSGGAVARRIYRQFRGQSEVMVARIANNTDTTWVEPYRLTPAPPVLYVWAAFLPIPGSSVWRHGFGVRYAIEFEYPDGTVLRSRWWTAEVQDAEGYSFHSFAFPVIHLPCDPSGQIVARRMIRQFHGLPERMVARIADNTATTWQDNDPGTADMMPPTYVCFATFLPLIGSPVWKRGFGVRYAVEFEYASGDVVRSGWWRAEAQDDAGYSFHSFALAVMNIPCAPSGPIVARRMIRQFHGLPERRVARIANNTDTSWFDPDRGTIDVPGLRQLAAVHAAQRGGGGLFFAIDGEALGHAHRSDGPHVDRSSFTSAGAVGGPIAALHSPTADQTEVFLRGADGFLHRFYGSAGNWRWEHYPFVLAGKLGSALCVVFAAQRNHSEAFLRDEQGYVHCFYFVDGAWHHDEATFRGAGRSNGDLSALFARQRNHSELFAAGEDGYLHYYAKPRGEWTHGVMDFGGGGKVVGAISAVFSRCENHAEVFYRGEDGCLHRFHVPRGIWEHQSGAALPAGAVTGDICAIYDEQRDHSEVFYRGEDGLLHHLYDVGGTWVQDGESFRASGAVNGPIAATFNPVQNHAEVYFADEAGRLHHYFVESGTWRHELVPRTEGELAASPKIAGLPASRAPTAPPELRLQFFAGPETFDVPSLCPVLEMDGLTFWPLSFVDARASMGIVACDGEGNFSHWVEAVGARYVWRITVDANARTATFWGQSNAQTVLTWDQLKKP